MSEEKEEEQETPEYSPKSDFSKGILTFECVKLCIESRAKEMKAGYENITADKSGNEIRIKIPDSRKAFTASVDALRGLLHPECLRDKRFKEFFEEFKKRKEELFNEFAYTERIKVEGDDGNPKWIIKNNARTYMPEADAVLPGDDLKKPDSTFMSPIQGIWDINVNLYWNEMVELYDALFAELNLLIDRLNYFRQVRSF